MEVHVWFMWAVVVSRVLALSTALEREACKGTVQKPPGRKSSEASVCTGTTTTPSSEEAFGGVGDAHALSQTCAE